ncbi:MAG TPA: hypothetical protein ENJ35_04255 [Gammaproteobacteria bacterium]|nr:hypothetical protein [Gammaproteobacteria bacterium]
MSKVELSTDDVIEAFCRMLEPSIKKGVLPIEDCNKYGVDVLYNKRDASLLQFHFITRDMLEVNLQMDLMELQRDGKAYLDRLMLILSDQLPKARKQRQEENQLTLNTPTENKPALPSLRPTVEAHNKVYH